jgi:hypothetical protein
MKKVFLSMPMNGKTDEEIKNTIEAVKAELDKRLKGEEYEILKSYFEEYPEEAKKEFDGNIAAFYLSKAIGVLAKADIAVFVNDWVRYRGCTCEHYIATKYKIKCIYVNTRNKISKIVQKPTKDVNEKTKKYQKQKAKDYVKGQIL